MFILDLFEAQQKQTLVLIPGGFHPFHPGHLSLYRAAEQAFPGAHIVYVATDDRKDRPFPFAEKQKLAQIAGVNPKNFQLVKSPFVAKEVTGQYDPDNTVLIFARSEKDRNEPPGAGGVKKDGTPSYLQPYHKGNLAPMSQHGYMVYLPTVQFDAGPSGVTSATQIRTMWPQADDAQKNAIIADLYPRNPAVARQILDKYLGGGLAEGFNDTVYPNAEVIKSKNGKPVGEIYQDANGWGCFHYKADNGADSISSREEALEWLKDLHDEYRQDRSLREQGVAEGLDGRASATPAINKRGKFTSWDENEPMRLKCQDGEFRTIQEINVLRQKMGMKPFSIKGEQGVAEGRVLHRDLKSWTDDAKSQGLNVIKPKNDLEWTHHATDKTGKVCGKFCTTNVPQNSRGFIHKQGVAEGLLDKFVKPKMKFNIETAGEELYVDVTLGGKQVAGFTFDMLGHDLEAQDMSVTPEYRGQGIAQTVYDMLKAKGFRINRSQHQTDAGSHFWDKNKGAGSKVWEQDVAEEIVDEKSVSKAQFRTMAAAAHNPKFAKKVGISQNVAQEFHHADKKQSYKSLPNKVDEDQDVLAQLDQLAESAGIL